MAGMNEKSKVLLLALVYGNGPNTDTECVLIADPQSQTAFLVMELFMTEKRTSVINVAPD